MTSRNSNAEQAILSVLGNVIEVIVAALEALVGLFDLLAGFAGL